MRLQTLDWYRAIAVLVVFLFHFEREFPQAPLGFFLGGPLGVDIFFVLSGFLLTYTILRSRAQGTFRLSSYATKRIRRLVPAYYAALLGAILLTPIALNTPLAWADMGAHLLFIHNLIPPFHGSFFSVEWTLGVEMQFYLLIPLLVLWCGTSLRRILAIGIGALILSIGYKAVLFLGFFPQMSVWDQFIWGTQLIARIDQFIMGALLCYGFQWLLPNLSQRGKQWLGSPWLWMLMTFLGAALFWYYGTIINQFWDLPIMMIWPTLFGAVIVLGMASSLLLEETAPRLYRSMTVKPVLWIAQYSYGIYLWHQIWMTQIARWALPWQYAFGAAVALTLLSAVLSFHIIEQPFLSAKNN